MTVKTHLKCPGCKFKIYIEQSQGFCPLTVTVDEKECPNCGTDLIIGEKDTRFVAIGKKVKDLWK